MPKPNKVLCTCVGTCKKSRPMPKGVVCRLDKGAPGKVMGPCAAVGMLKADGSRRCKKDAPLRELVGQIAKGRVFLCDTHARYFAAEGFTVRVIFEDELPMS